MPGRAAATPVILLHGWPYDIYSFAEAVPLLAAAGKRVIVPYLRGYGATRFRSADTLRNGQQAALAVDVIALMDALGIAARRDRRVRLGRAHRQYRRGAVAGALQGAGLGQRLSDRQPRGEPQTPAARRGIPMVVPILLRDRTGRAGLRDIPPRIRPADLGPRLAPMALRRRHFRAQCRVVRQSGPCRES